MAPAALDGGWGWVVVASGFVALLLGYGSPQAVGVLYPEWVLAFREGKATTAWVGSLVLGGGLIVGPVCSVCVASYGARAVVVFGGMMVSGGLILSAFAPSILFLVFSYGVVVGVGVGLLYSAVLTITCLYFDRRRGLALGLVSTGTSVGGILFASLQSMLIELFGLDGCLIIIGALALNIVPSAAAMRPLTSSTYYVKHSLERVIKKEEEAVTSNQKPSANNEVITMETNELVRRRSLFSSSAFTKAIKSTRRRYSQCLSSMFSLLQDRVLVALCVSLFIFSLGQYLFFSGFNFRQSHFFFSGFFFSAKDAEDVGPSSAGSFPPQLFLEDLAQSTGLLRVKPSVSTVSLFSIGAGMGKIGLGVMADLPWVDSVVLYALTVTASGLGVLLLPLTSSYMDLQVLAMVLGFMSGNWTLTPYATGQVVGMDKLAEAHGILMFFGGLGLTLGAPVIGSFYDVCQSYNAAFYLSGGGMMVGGGGLFLTAILTRSKPTLPPSTTSKAKLNSCMVTMATDATTPVT
ncbi:hypothetical protein PAMA_012040 [Pampus argenteus]